MVSLAAGVVVVPSRYLKSCTPLRMGITYAFQSKKLVLINLHEITVAIFEEVMGVDMADLEEGQKVSDVGE